jgi:hypothetical protein
VSFIGLMYLLAAIALFLVVPVFAITGTWKRLEPGVRRALVVLYVVVVALCGLLYWMFDRWSSSGPID